MIGIQIASHGGFSKGIVDSLDMIIGNLEAVEPNVLSRDSDFETFRNTLLESTNSLMGDDGVIVFVDMFGATPYNAAMYNSQHFNSDKYAVIAGYNLPLLVEAVVNRENMNITELVSYIESVAGDTIVVGEILQA